MDIRQRAEGAKWRVVEEKMRGEPEGGGGARDRKREIAAAGGGVLMMNGWSTGMRDGAA